MKKAGRITCSSDVNCCEGSCSASCYPLLCSSLGRGTHGNYGGTTPWAWTNGFTQHKEWTAVAMEALWFRYPSRKHNDISLQLMPLWIQGIHTETLLFQAVPSQWEQSWNTSAQPSPLDVDSSVGSLCTWALLLACRDSQNCTAAWNSSPSSFPISFHKVITVSLRAGFLLLLLPPLLSFTEIFPSKSHLIHLGFCFLEYPNWQYSKSKFKNTL